MVTGKVMSDDLVSFRASLRAGCSLRPGWHYRHTKAAQTQWLWTALLLDWIYAAAVVNAQYCCINVLQAYGVDGLEVKLGKIVPSSQCVVRMIRLLIMIPPVFWEARYWGLFLDQALGTQKRYMWCLWFACVLTFSSKIKPDDLVKFVWFYSGIYIEIFGRPIWICSALSSDCFHRWQSRLVCCNDFDGHRL